MMQGDWGWVLILEDGRAHVTFMLEERPVLSQLLRLHSLGEHTLRES